MKKIILIYILFLGSGPTQGQPSEHDLHFDSLATRWDEAIPLGNGMLGALVWQQDGRLRFSLDRADLWDLRPMKGLHRNEFKYQWVYDQVQKKDYKIVQDYFDAPYDREPGPTKIPGAAIEFESDRWGRVSTSHLYLDKARCEIKWANGVVLNTFIHATLPVGRFRFEHLRGDFLPQVIAPRYEGTIKVSGDPVGGDDLSRLDYQQGRVKREGNTITYVQYGWDGFYYRISLRWVRIDPSTIEGVWSISSQYPQHKLNQTAESITDQALQRNYARDAMSHEDWWKNFWSKSSIHITDQVIEKQWYLDQYKFGSSSRRGAPPISLQAIWTADNGRIPPWKGDYHHDLNTQLSYWPCYAANHLEEGLAYLDHLEANKNNYKRYTRLYFGMQGLSVPGVTTLDGTEMGGWIQYSLSPTVSCWLAQHFYLHWRYSMDKNFLKQEAYPWIKETASFIESLSVPDARGFRKLPMSSSPEINDNKLSAWFDQNTNYDLALMKFCFKIAEELAGELKLTAEAAHWHKLRSEFGDYALTDHNELKFSPTVAYNQSHRHFSHMMAIHPLGLIRWEDGVLQQSIIKNSIRVLDSIGSDEWVGYSFAWLANLKARAKDGEGAAKALEIFTKAFCSVNSFHLNGDQSRSGLSKFTYRPFTLEGNFAAAAGLQEMMLQSYAGFIEVMPAVPLEWKDIEFKQLRAEGACLVSAKKINGRMEEVLLETEKSGKLSLKLPFEKYTIASLHKIKIMEVTESRMIINAKPGGNITIRNGL